MVSLLLALSNLVSITTYAQWPFHVGDVLQTFDWDSGKTYVYHCEVSVDGSYKFKVCTSTPQYTCNHTQSCASLCIIACSQGEIVNLLTESVV